MHWLRWQRTVRSREAAEKIGEIEDGTLPIPGFADTLPQCAQERFLRQ